ncbi:Tellurite methyltransferase [Nocardioides dokdonensis FR1436]|uniref:Tellurite methyltransferase n=1 Tax=Nocardioides dokdonensis FR1436 TaxID=1300347 RepID=A0A1A9GK12_9ACTN|nr:class I SAM-dependent methyltransferase [Nocardioides dokdonensis]ANH38416.1 Tellurite methyltransferase [Nocardioides dokdonensis FR1436]
MSEHGAGPMWTAEFWDERYAEKSAIWSGRPNARLVEHVASLPPGTALDVGCGEGADALWLAGRGWQVTGVDLSQVALDRAAARAREEGLEIDLRQRDLISAPVPGTFDLVSVFFMHVPRPVFDGLYAKLAAAVRPGGSLLVVAHHPDDEHTGVRRPRGEDLLFGPERVTALLDDGEWDVRVADTPTRSQDLDGAPVTVTDTVVHSVRR